MRASDPLLQVEDIPAALSLLSRWPLRVSPTALSRGAATAWCWPLAGLALAGLAIFFATIAQTLGIKPEIAALLALTLMIVQTGALHEDGLADVADGMWGGTTPARRLEIMKDSAIGSYGTLALILSLALRGAALMALADHLAVALFTAAALSRAAMPAMMAALPHARPDGLSAHTGRPSAATLATALALAALATILLTGWAAPWLLAIAALTTLACMKIACHKIGGQTGDTLGATQQVTEITTLLALTALL